MNPGLLRMAVEGASMEPALEAGDRLVVVRWLRPRPGDIVAVIDPRDAGRTMLKRVAAVDVGSGDLTVIGDNTEASTDSRVFGPVPPSGYRGRAVYRYHPARQAGRLRRPGGADHRD